MSQVLDEFQNFSLAFLSRKEVPNLILMDSEFFETFREGLDLMIEETKQIYYGEILDDKLKDNFEGTMFFTIYGRTSFIRSIPKLGGKYEFYKKL